MQGRLHSFQSLGTVDGPGVRSVVFVQGCALRCPYCHNPDTWDKNAGTLVDAQDVFARICRYKSYFGRDGGVTISGGEPLYNRNLSPSCSRFAKDGFPRRSIPRASA